MQYIGHGEFEFHSEQHGKIILTEQDLANIRSEIVERKRESSNSPYEDISDMAKSQTAEKYGWQKAPSKRKVK